MKEAHCAKFNSEGDPASYVRGKHQIDGAHCTFNIVTAAVSICPFSFWYQ